jgi:hypothetical protein
MKNSLFACLFLFANFFGYSQMDTISLPITWDDTSKVNYSVTDFGGNVSSRAVDPNDSNNLVLKSVKGNQTWAGTTLGISSGLKNVIPFAAGSTIIKAVVYSPVAGIEVRMKAEDKNDATKSVETNVTTTVANGWDTLTFDFSKESKGTAAINFSYTFDKLSIFYNFNNTGTAQTYYVDAIFFVGSGTPPPPKKAQINLPITWDDTSKVDYSSTDFGGNISSMAMDPMNSTNLVLKSIKGNQTWAGTTLGAPGLAKKIPFVTGETVIKAVVYSPAAGLEVRMKAEDKTDGTKSVETNVSTTVANGWDTLTFDFSNPSTGTGAINFATTYDKLSIFYNYGSAGTAQTYYVDAIFFVGSGTPPPPKKAQINLPITWDDTSKVDYSVTDFGGNASSLAADPKNAMNMVLKSEKTGAAQTWAGTTLGTPAGLAKKIPFVAGSTLIKAVVYSPKAGIVVRMKAENKKVGTTSVETEVTTSVANDWDTLTFDFSQQASGTAPINFDSIYDKVSIFYNFNVDGATAGAQTYYVDDVFFSTGGGTPPVPDTSNVTFRLDMNEYTGTFTTPEVNGEFNNWCGTCDAMTDSNSDNIWEVTVQITLDTFEFKYSFDNWTGQESLDSNLSCIKQTGTFVNRILGVKGDTTLPAVCWESCVECKTSSSLESNYSNSRVSIYPNPTKGEVFVEILDANLELQEVTIVNSLGKIMYSKNVNSNQIHGIDVSYFQTGIYFVKVNSLGNQIVKKLLITE